MLETHLFVLCSDSETNEQQREGSCGAKSIPFGVQASENEFQTRQYEPRVAHQECAKSVDHTTSRGVRIYERVAEVESLKSRKKRCNLRATGNNISNAKPRNDARSVIAREHRKIIFFYRYIYIYIYTYIYLSFPK